MEVKEMREALCRMCEDVEPHDCLNGICELEPHCKRFECDFDNAPDEMIYKWYAIAFPKPTIKDSGHRRAFESGAIRDMGNDGEKGRCDLLPLNVLSDDYKDMILMYINNFQESGDVGYLQAALEDLPDALGYDSRETMYLELAKHYFEGSKKYGIDNWKKGIPLWCYIDSAVRHWLKLKRGDKDEPHDRAFVWNIVCAIWTCKMKPELNDYRKEAEDGKA